MHCVLAGSTLPDQHVQIPWPMHEVKVCASDLLEVKVCVRLALWHHVFMVAGAWFL